MISLRPFKPFRSLCVKIIVKGSDFPSYRFSLMRTRKTSSPPRNCKWIQCRTSVISQNETTHRSMFRACVRSLKEITRCLFSKVRNFAGNCDTEQIKSNYRYRERCKISTEIELNSTLWYCIIRVFCEENGNLFRHSLFHSRIITAKQKKIKSDIR